MAGVGVSEAKDLICELCRLFYDQGWVSGTGGGISVKAGDDRIVMAPSGVQKERMQPSDMYVLDSKGDVVEEPKARPPPYPAPKLSECSPLFMAVRICRPALLPRGRSHVRTHQRPPIAAGRQSTMRAHMRALDGAQRLAAFRPAAGHAAARPTAAPRPGSPKHQAYELRGAGAVMHSHSLNAVMATMLDPQATEFTVTHLEMIKVRSYAPRPSPAPRRRRRCPHPIPRQRARAPHVKAAGRAPADHRLPCLFGAAARSRRAPDRRQSRAASPCARPAGHRGPRVLWQLRGAHYREHRARV
jgi:hypothetical protein